jgi:hypothetical protein
MEIYIICSNLIEKIHQNEYPAPTLDVQILNELIYMKIIFCLNH